MIDISRESGVFLEEKEQIKRFKKRNYLLFKKEKEQTKGNYLLFKKEKEKKKENLTNLTN